MCVSDEAQVCIVSRLGTSRKHRAMACEVGCNTVGSVNRFVEGKHQPFHSLFSIISVFGVNGTSPAAALIATNRSFCLLAAPYVNRLCTRSPLSKLFFAKHRFHFSGFYKRCHLKQIQGIRHYSPLHMPSPEQILSCCLLFLHFLHFSPSVECYILSCLLQFWPRSSAS